MGPEARARIAEAARRRPLKVKGTNEPDEPGLNSAEVCVSLTVDSRFDWGEDEMKAATAISWLVSDATSVCGADALFEF